MHILICDCVAFAISAVRKLNLICYKLNWFHILLSHDITSHINLRFPLCFPVLHTENACSWSKHYMSKCVNQETKKYYLFLFLIVENDYIWPHSSRKTLGCKGLVLFLFFSSNVKYEIETPEVYLVFNSD